GSGNPKCANCMVSCGYEPSAVLDGFGSLKGFFAMVKGSFSLYPDQHALNLLNEPMPTGKPLVQIQAGRALEETRA
ncbi:MAG: hopanoid biosynthesis associated radical SAM protein HpnH, partial [Terracidiphilus sp.]